MGLRSCLSRLRRWLRRPAPVAAVAPRRRLQLEQLEARDVPAVLSGDTYLATLYQGFLGRPIDANGQIFWRQILATTGSRTTVAADILSSHEYRARELQIVYPTLLGRPLDRAGLAFWGNVLESGGTYEQVKTGIFGSQEFFDRSGDTLPGFITNVFRSQVGRNPTASDLAFWEGRLGSGESRQAVAAQILGSDEAHQVELSGVYQEILSRPLDAAGASFWGAVLRRPGESVNTVLAGVAGSDEYFGQLTRYLTLNNSFNDVNQAATGFLDAGAKFDAQLPGVEQLDRLITTNAALRTAPNNASVISAGAPTTAGPVGVGPSATTPVGPVGVGPSATIPPATLSSFGVNSANSFITGVGSFTTTGPGSVTTTGPGSFTTTGPGATITTGPGSFFTSGPGSVTTTGPGSFTTTGFGAVPTTGLQSFITSGPGAFTSTRGPTFL